MWMFVFSERNRLAWGARGVFSALVDWSREAEALHPCVFVICWQFAHIPRSESSVLALIQDQPLQTHHSHLKECGAELRSAADVIADADNRASSWGRSRADCVARRSPPAGCLQRSVAHLQWDAGDTFSMTVFTGPAAVEICCWSETAWAACGSLPEDAFWNILWKESTGVWEPVQTRLFLPVQVDCCCLVLVLLVYPHSHTVHQQNTTDEAAWPALTLG